MEFDTKDSLSAFAGIAMDDLLQVHVEDAVFTVPTSAQYLKITKLLPRTVTEMTTIMEKILRRSIFSSAMLTTVNEKDCIL